MFGAVARTPCPLHPPPRALGRYTLEDTAAGRKMAATAAGKSGDGTAAGGGDGGGGGGGAGGLGGSSPAPRALFDAQPRPSFRIWLYQWTKSIIK